MITPEQMTSYERNKVIEQYEKLNQDLTASIIKKLKSNGDISSYTKSQIKQLARQGGKEIFNEALAKTNGISKVRKAQIQLLFDEVAQTQLNGYAVTYKAKGKELVMSKSMQKLISTSYTRTNKTLKNLTKTIAFSTKQEYVKAVDDLYKKVLTGSYDYNSAIKSTINELASKGITLKSNGRNYTLEGMVKNNLMTSLTQTTNDMAKEIGGVIGANCVEIGHTPSCRPSHRVIDGVIMSIDKFKEYEYLTEEPNCYHIVNYDWREEFDYTTNKVINNGHLTERQYDINYTKRQKQNYYARQVRDKKNQVTNLEKSGSTDAKVKRQLRLAQSKYRQYCKSNNLTVDYNLTWKSGYNK